MARTFRMDPVAVLKERDAMSRAARIAAAQYVIDAESAANKKK